MIVPKLSDILVVDDSPLLRNVLVDLLEECGFSARSASDGFTALAAMRERLPDVLLSDLQMPGMSGFELLSIVRFRFPSVLAVAMSGAYAGVDIPPGVAADAFYAKGASSIARLIELVTCLIERREVGRSRETVPVWIPRLPEHGVAASSLLFACRECLRVSAHPFREFGSVGEPGSCRHCFQPVRFALVHQSGEPDMTLPRGITT